MSIVYEMGFCMFVLVHIAQQDVKLLFFYKILCAKL